MRLDLLLWIAALTHVVAAFDPKVLLTKLEGDTYDVLYFDDSTHIISARSDGLWASFDDGAKWQNLKKDVEAKALSFDPNVKERAFAFTHSTKQYYTTDKGKTWKEFELKNHDESVIVNQQPLIIHNVADPNLILFQLVSCQRLVKGFPEDCKKQFFYTADGLKLVKKLPVDAELCVFGKGSTDFAFSGDPKTIFCAKHKLNSFGHVMESSIVKSSDFFKSETEISDAGFKSGRILDLRVDASFMVAMVLSDRFNTKSHISLFVSKDGDVFDKSNLDVEVNQGAVMFLPSLKLALFLEVVQLRRRLFPVTSVWRSDSQGINFQNIADKTLYFGTIKLENFDGVWFSAFLRETDSQDGGFFGGGRGGVRTSFTSKVSINDGQDWQPLRLLDDDNCKIENGCSLNLIDIATVDGMGKFTTGPTANIIIGVGNAGDPSQNEKDWKTYVSRDGGITWTKAIDEPCAFAYGDQGNIIFAMSFPSILMEEPSRTYYYSLDQGKTWTKGTFENPFIPITLISTLDGTGKKFLAAGPDRDQKASFFVLVDFSDAFGGTKCKENDLEKVYARVVNDEPLCIYGHKESLLRRKQDAKCFVSKLFEDIKVKEEPCECVEADYECSKYFRLSPKGACVPNDEKIKEVCAAKKLKKIKLADKQLMAGNLCKENKKFNFILEEEFDCNAYKDKDDSQKKVVGSVPHEFEGRLAQYSYVKTADDMNENLLVRTSNNMMYASNDGGLSFRKIPVNEKLVWFALGATPGSAILLTDNRIFYLSDDGANTFKKLEAPGRLAPTRGLNPTFHPTDEKEFIWYTSEGCDPQMNPECEVTAHYTTDGGLSFQKLRSGIRFCDYISLNNDTLSNLIYCLTSEKKQKLVYTENYFKETEPKVLFDYVASYAVKPNYVIVATVLEDREEMRAKVTMDGKTFADASFPKDFKVEAQTAYNILDSSDHSIFMHVTTDSTKDRERGALLKSNSNGTFYVLSLNDVNRGKIGYVDYDRIQALEGVILANTVSNPEKDEKKKLKTQISFNDGSEWTYLAPPNVDSEGKKTKCSGLSLKKCSLHLQGYTERPDYTDTYGSSSAVGVLFGVGNVGEYLGDGDLATYMSLDAGLSWKEVVKGQHMWEFGDQGSVLVLTDQLKETNTLMYSTNGGDDWQEFKFADKKVFILDLATVQSDTSLKFVIFGSEKQDLHTTYAYSIDFTKYFDRQCQLNLEKPDSDDFEYWTPRRPFSKDNCLFGKENKYLRRKSHSNCFIGGAPLKDGFKESRICTCTRADYECDYNYYRDSDGTCKLVDGLSPADRMKEMCEVEGTFQYFVPTGYRKIPLSKCEGGKGFDSMITRPCPGHEKEYNDFYGIGLGGGRIFGIIFAPVFVFLAAFLIASWFVYERGIRRNGGFQRLGQIRLDDDDDFQPIEENTVDVVVNKIVRGGILTVAGAVAVLKTIRKVDRAMLERLSLSLFGRRPGQRSYVRVPDDEDELFGNFEDNYEDELENADDINFEVEDDPVEFTEYADEPPNENDNDADERLFGIDDQSDEDRSSRITED